MSGTRLLAVVTSACTGCGACLPPCAPHAVTLETERPGGLGAKRAVVDAARCTGCGDCVAPCPHGAILLRRREGDARWARRDLAGAVDSG